MAWTRIKTVQQYLDIEKSPTDSVLAVVYVDGVLGN